MLNLVAIRKGIIAVLGTCAHLFMITPFGRVWIAWDLEQAAMYFIILMGVAHTLYLELQYSIRVFHSLNLCFKA